MARQVTQWPMYSPNYEFAPMFPNLVGPNGLQVLVPDFPNGQSRVPGPGHENLLVQPSDVEYQVFVGPGSNVDRVERGQGVDGDVAGLLRPGDQQSAGFVDPHRVDPALDFQLAIQPG